MDGTYPHSSTDPPPTYDQIGTDTNSGNFGKHSSILNSVPEIQNMQQGHQMQMPPQNMQQGHQMHMPQQQQHTNIPQNQMISGVGILPVVSNPLQYGPHEQFAMCPSCRMQIKTRIERESNRSTHLTALCLFCIGCCLCSCIPYLMSSCKNTNHYCPNCSAYLGTYSTSR